MPALFSRRSNSILLATLISLGTLAIGAPVVLVLAARTPYVTESGNPVDQPVFFDHRHHVGDDRIDCRYCHDLVERSTTAGVPPTERCIGCHSQIWSDSDLLDPVWRSYRSGEPIRWVRVHRLPAFVYFDHSAHVTGGVGCVTCHGRVDRMARVYQAEPLTMQWCLDCHRDPEPHLRPRDWITSMAREVDAQPGERVAPVAPGTHCTTCHR